MQIPGKKKKKKTSSKMVFQPEYAEDISYVYLANQIFESVYLNKYQKG